MASFLIYQDQENSQVVPANKNAKDGQKLSKRAILGDISRSKNGENTISGNNDPVNSKQPDKNVRVPLKSQKQLGLNGDKSLKVNELRSPLRDLVVSSIPPRDVENENNETEVSPSSDESEMSIDKSPTACNLLAETIKLQLEGLYDCDTYKDDIYRYLRQLETKHRPKAYYMRRQPDVTYSMRAILVDWLVEVGEEYKLHNETLFMAVSYIDRFLSIMAVVRAKLQLLGTSAMFIASKFEEIYPPEIGEFTYITDDTYTKKQVLRMEHLILKVLSFNLSCPTAYTFVVHLSVTASLPDNVFMLAMYLCELTLLEADPYLQYNPSLIASAAIALARHCLGYIEVWTQSLVRASGYNLHNLATVVAHLNSTHSKAATAAPHAIKEKYKVMKYHRVSLVPCKKLIVRGSIDSN